MSDRKAALAGIAGCILFWAALFLFGAARPDRPMKENPDWRVMSNVSLALGLMAIACVGLRATTIVLPGMGQRIAFAVYFAWFFIMSIQLFRVQGLLRGAAA